MKNAPPGSGGAFAVLEVEFAGELKDARVSCGQDLPERCYFAANIGRVEVGVVKRIEYLRPEQHRALLIQLEVLCNIKIEIGVAWPAHHSHARGAESLRRRLEC